MLVLNVMFWFMIFKHSVESLETLYAIFTLLPNQHNYTNSIYSYWETFWKANLMSHNKTQNCTLLFNIYIWKRFISITFYFLKFFSSKTRSSTITKLMYYTSLVFSWAVFEKKNQPTPNNYIYRNTYNIYCCS